MESRNYNIDLLKILSSIAVIGLHSFRINNIFCNVLYFSCGFAVPIFFTINGLLLFEHKNINQKYFNCKIFNILKFFLLWAVMVSFYDIVQQLINRNDVENVFIVILYNFYLIFFQCGYLWHFWYLFSLILIYLFLSPKIISKNKNDILILFCFIVMLLLDIFSIVKKMPLQSYVPQAFRIWTWFFYFLLGNKIVFIKEKIQKKINLKIHFACCCLISIINIFYQILISKKIYSDFSFFYVEYFYDNVFQIIWIVFLFTFILRINFSDKIICIIKFLSPLTFGVYILHPFLLNLFPFESSFFSTVILFIFISTLSFSLIFILSKTFIKYFFKF